MLTAALQNASVLSYVDGLFSADMVKLYKPAKKIYNSLVAYINASNGRLAGVSVTPDRVWLVSGCVLPPRCPARCLIAHTAGDVAGILSM